jgi:SAM-dependent methyltransferase
MTKSSEPGITLLFIQRVKMASPSIHVPSDDCAWVPTENHFGYHIDTLSVAELSFIKTMIDTAKGQSSPQANTSGGLLARSTVETEGKAPRLRIADLGCGLGFTTECMLRKFRKGVAFDGRLDATSAERITPSVKDESTSPSGVEIDVIAADLDGKHLAALMSRLPEVDKARLSTIEGDCTALPFPSGHLNGILACRWVHFLDGPQLRAFFRTASEWLVPGGVICITTESPRLGTTKAEFLPMYEKKKSEGVEWPGIRMLPTNGQYNNCPAFLHLLDPDIMIREAKLAGWEIIACDYIPRPYYPPALVFDNKESSYLLARKPATAAS